MLLSFSTIFILTIFISKSSSQSCDKEILEDVCPQREGFDEDCERQCQTKYPMRISSGCHLRNSGTLLSLFGIRSYQCKCQLPIHFCVSSVGLNPFRQSFSLAAISSHSKLQKIATEHIQCDSRNKQLQCPQNFGYGQCDWIRSGGADWFEASEIGHSMQMMEHEKPVSNYLVAVGRQGVSSILLSTCDGLCSQGSVNVTLRMWKSPWIQANLCFKERDNLFCAPMQSGNGQWTNETIPRTDNFQIYFKFTNVTESDAIMLDDIKAEFVHCDENSLVHTGPLLPETSVTTFRPRIVTPIMTTEEHRVSGVSFRTGVEDNNIHRVVSASTPETVNPIPGLRSDDRIQENIESLKKRLCHFGECTTITHQPTHIVEAVRDRTCVGRIGFMKCKDKCREQSGLSAGARCLRQKEFPFTKRCICQVRRSPSKVVKENTFTEHNRIVEATTEETATLRPVRVTPAAKTFKESPAHLPVRSIEPQIIQPISRPASENTINMICGLDGDNTECDQHCKLANPESSGTCRMDDALPSCVCSSCFSSLCNFEKNANCEWTDLRLISTQFNNISIAAKKDQINRYGLTRLPPSSYSGLLRRGSVEGPIQLSVDVYPSHEIDVRICVDSFNKCQSQTVGPTAWNRISAKIKVAKTEKIFLLFHNKHEDISKTIALDNISLQNGKC